MTVEEALNYLKRSTRLAIAIATEGDGDPQAEIALQIIEAELKKKSETYSNKRKG